MDCHNNDTKGGVGVAAELPRVAADLPPPNCRHTDVDDGRSRNEGCWWEKTILRMQEGVMQDKTNSVFAL